MLILLHNDGFPAASFNNKESGYQFYNNLNEEIKKDLRPFEANLYYTYYMVWSWDLKDPNDKSKYNIEFMSAWGVQDYVKTLKRDKEFEKTEEFDNQYFYLDPIKEDGFNSLLNIKLGFKKEIFYPSSKGMTGKWYIGASHIHADWDMINRIKNMGVERTIMYPKEISAENKSNYKFKKLKRLEKVVRNKTPENILMGYHPSAKDKTIKKYKRLKRWYQSLF